MVRGLGLRLMRRLGMMRRRRRGCAGPARRLRSLPTSRFSGLIDTVPVTDDLG